MRCALEKPARPLAAGRKLVFDRPAMPLTPKRSVSYLPADFASAKGDT